jgi:hypothetical protein
MRRCRVPRVHALLLAADEPSKTPFYIVGIALAGWAVLVAFVGITQPEFPRNPGGRVAVILVTACLVVGAMAVAVITA